MIPHALAMNVPYAKPKTYSFPAQRTDGASTDPNAIPEGARFRLDPKLDVDALNVPPMTKAMAKAAQRYGMIVRDQTAHAISFFAENPSQSQLATNPYTGPGGLYGRSGPDRGSSRLSVGSPAAREDGPAHRGVSASTAGPDAARGSVSPATGACTARRSGLCVRKAPG